jgi:hypothetical protein
MGLHHPDEYPELGRDSFVQYQNRVAVELNDLAARHGWTRVVVAPDATAGQTTATVCDVLGIRPEVA